ncbi:MAG: DAK2 domain-containing protein [Clostridia bacterium]|nr:DAK2 domain-containing protein [Clostridia bacterium]
MAIKRIDGMMLKEMFSSGAALLVNNREQVDALNVFPVPDGDTGTNMSQTISSAIKEINAKPYTSVADVSNAAAKGALRGARGNSGVILSQILRGFAKALAGHEEIDGPLLGEMLRSGANTAYKAVMKPKEGTILTVIRVIAEEAEEARDKQHDVVEMFRLVLSVGDAILKRTPEMLPVLKQAGVVDSGGMGLMVVLRGMYSALTGEPVDAIVTEAAPGAHGSMPGEYVDDHEALEDIKFGYCTEFIVSHPREGLKDDEVVRLRRRLERIGDCVLVIADMNVVKVHVHTNEPGMALQYALVLGELDAIKIDNMFEERRERDAKMAEEAARKAAEQKEYGIVAVALGEGLVTLFKDLNVDQVVDGGQTMNPSIEDLAQACDATNARNVIILPNNTNIILAAQQAMELTDRNVIVLPTKSVPMGISAALAFDPSLSPQENELAMREAAEQVHTASITYAVRDTNYDGQEIHEHDIMGMLDNKLTVLGNDLPQVAKDITEKMVTGESGLITIYYGQDVAEADAQALRDALAETYPDCDVELQNGGQPLYYYLIAVE